MIISPKEFKLKNGRIAQIRSPEEKDAQGMLDYLSLSTEETQRHTAERRNPPS